MASVKDKSKSPKEKAEEIDWDAEWEAMTRKLDTREIRSPDSRAYAILNDSEKEVSPSVVDALQNYEVKPVLWSRRGAVLAELVA